VSKKEDGHKSKTEDSHKEARKDTIRGRKSRKKKACERTKGCVENDVAIASENWGAFGLILIVFLSHSSPFLFVSSRASLWLSSVLLSFASLSSSLIVSSRASLWPQF
jgi:hypothetical protein